MIYFGILRIFGEKNAKGQKPKSRHFGPLRLNVGNPRRSVGCLAAARPKVSKWHPSSTPLRRGEGLSRSVAMLRRNVATIHRGENFGFLFQKSRIHTLIV